MSAATRKKAEGMFLHTLAVKLRTYLVRHPIVLHFKFSKVSNWTLTKDLDTCGFTALLRCYTFSETLSSCKRACMHGARSDGYGGFAASPCDAR